MPEFHRPEIPLSDVFESAAVDTIIHVESHPKEADEERRVWRTFVGYLGERAFTSWTGIKIPRPILGLKRDRGDVAGGGSITSAQFYEETQRAWTWGPREKPRTDQNWRRDLESEKHNPSVWMVFMSIEFRRDLGPANSRQVEMARRCLFTRRWIENGRWFEPVAVLWGWNLKSYLEEVCPKVEHPKDGHARGRYGSRQINWRNLKPWPEHERPVSKERLQELLGIGREDDREEGLRTLRRIRDGLFEQEGAEWKGD